MIIDSGLQLPHFCRDFQRVYSFFIFRSHNSLCSLFLIYFNSPRVSIFSCFWRIYSASFTLLFFFFGHSILSLSNALALFLSNMPSKATRSSAKSPSDTKPQVNLKALPSRRNGKTSTSPHLAHHLVLDLSLPSHIISDRSLFTTYTSSRKLHKTVFGNDIIIEGYGDVHIRTFAGTKSILFRLRDCWHVPSSPHHFLSCKRVISQGMQIMLAGRTPRMIYSHKDRLAEPQSPKYVPFTQDSGNFVLKFQIPVLSDIQPHSTSTIQPFLSLQASCHDHLFAGLAFNENPLPTPQQVSFSRPSATVAMVAPDVMSGTSVDVVPHGGAESEESADALMGMDECFRLSDFANVSSHGDVSAHVVSHEDADALDSDAYFLLDDATVTSHGGAVAQVMLANMHEDDSIVRVMTGSSSSAPLTPTASSLVFFNLEDRDSITFRASTCYYTHCYFPCVLSLPFILNAIMPCFPCSPLSSCHNSPLFPNYPLVLLSDSGSEFSFSASIQHSPETFSAFSSSFMIDSSHPIQVLSYLTSEFSQTLAVSLLASTYRPFSSLAVTPPLHFSSSGFSIPPTIPISQYHPSPLSTFPYNQHPVPNFQPSRVTWALSCIHHEWQPEPWFFSSPAIKIFNPIPLPPLCKDLLRPPVLLQSVNVEGYR